MEQTDSRVGPVFCCSVTQLCPTLCEPMDCYMPGFRVLHYLSELAQTHVHWVNDAIQPTYHLSSPLPALKLSQYHGLCQWVSSSHWVVKVLALQFHQESFQWIFRVDFLLDWLVWSPCCQESSAASQVKIINSLVLSLLCPQTFG